MLSLEEKRELRNEAIKLHRELGWGRRLISKKLRVVPEHTISSWLYRGSIPGRTYAIEYHGLSIEERLQIYDEAMKLRRERGWGACRIAKKLGDVPPAGTIYNWLHYDIKPIRKSRLTEKERRQRRRKSNKKHRDKNIALHNDDWYAKQDPDEEILCSKCEKMKPRSEFHKRRRRAEGYCPLCKDCFAKKPNRIYRSFTIGARQRDLPVKITKEDFIEWYRREPKKCCYCELPEEHLSLIDYIALGHRRRLEIERIDNRKGYAMGNIALACATCNQHHMKPLSFEAVRKFCRENIQPVWMKTVRETTRRRAGLPAKPKKS